MDCCSTSESTDLAMAVIVECPSCGVRGRPVRAITLDALLIAPSARSDGDFRFCATQRCSVVYYNGQDASTLQAAALKVRVSAKETRPDRPVCYCFGHTAAALQQDVERSGTSTITLAIKAACKAGKDRCEESNPEGRCCLGAVRSVVMAAQKKSPTS
jgi:hypothetical protein